MDGEDFLDTDDNNDSVFVDDDDSDNDSDKTPTKNPSKTPRKTQKKKKRLKINFQKRHELMYTVKPTFFQFNWSHVTHATCQLCVYFMREKKVNSKRELTAQIKDW